MIFSIKPAPDDQKQAVIFCLAGGVTLSRRNAVIACGSRAFLLTADSHSRLRQFKSKRLLSPYRGH